MHQFLSIFCNQLMLCFNAQLLPGRNLGSKSTFQSLFFIFFSATNIFCFFPNLQWKWINTKMCLFAPIQQLSSNFIIIYRALLFNCSIKHKLIFTLLSRVRISHAVFVFEIFSVPCNIFSFSTYCCY